MARNKDEKHRYDPLYPGDRATAPGALEADSPSMWATFEELQRAHEAPFADTQVYQPTAPGSPALGTPSFAATQPMESTRLPGLPQQPASGRRATLEDAMALVRRNNRSCPMPMQWAEFTRLLPQRQAQGRSFPPPPPIAGAAWTATSAMQKRLRLRDQIEWAQREGVLGAAYEYLASLDEEQWHHFEE